MLNTVLVNQSLQNLENSCFSENFHLREKNLEELRNNFSEEFTAIEKGIFVSVRMN